MEALVQHFPAEQVHEHADAAEKNRQPHVVQLKDAGEEPRRFGRVHRFSPVDLPELAVVKHQADIAFAVGVAVHAPLHHPPFAPRTDGDAKCQLVVGFGVRDMKVGPQADRAPQ